MKIMKRLSQAAYKAEVERIQRENVYRKRNQNLQELKDKYKQPAERPSTSKLMAFYLFLIMNIILLYAMIAMWHFRDLTYLGVLITDVAAQVLTYFIYTKKATRENTVGGIKYETAMKALEKVDPAPIESTEENGGMG